MEASPTPTEVRPSRRKREAEEPGRNETIAAIWFRIVQLTLGTIYMSFCSLRATGRQHIPRTGAGLIVANHLSHWDVFMIGFVAPRTLNYVARSTLFIPILGTLIRSVGGFPIQREGIGAQGIKETLKRVRAGGLVVLFPEGTRSRDGELAPLKSGIAMLAAKTKVPVIPAAIAGTYEGWPRWHRFPRMFPVRVVFGQPITVDEIRTLSPEELTALIERRIRDGIAEARASLRSDLNL